MGSRRKRLALMVPRAEGEAARSTVLSLGLLDTQRRIVQAGGHLEIPLKAADASFDGLGEVIEQERAVLSKRLLTPYQLVQREASLPSEVKARLPRRWEKVGEVLLLRFPQELRPHLEQVCRAYARVLGVKAILEMSGGISGTWREPKVELLWGDNTETVHKENGVCYKLDLRKVMFSSGNIDERVRMSKASQPGEVVVDMFAGIGYFSLPIAVHSRPSRVYACEANPVAFAYLRENIRINEANIVEPIQGDCREAAPEGVADRVILGYLEDTHIFLAKALRTLRSGGWLHYHEASPDGLAERLDRYLRKAAKSEGASVIGSTLRRIKSYAPGVSHYVLDAVIS